MQAPTLKQKALQCFRRGQLKKAKTLYEKICRQYPRDAEAWYMLASVYGQGGHYQRAADYYRKTLKIQPGAYVAQCGLGAALKQLGQYADAEYAFRQALAQQLFARRCLKAVRMPLSLATKSTPSTTIGVGMYEPLLGRCHSIPFGTSSSSERAMSPRASARTA